MYFFLFGYTLFITSMKKVDHENKFKMIDGCHSESVHFA